MKKVLRFEIEEGSAPECAWCPFNGVLEDNKLCCEAVKFTGCTDYDMSTLKFIGEENNENKN